MRSPNSRQRRPPGYTLVEVLTVCSIIAILAALAFPSMVQAVKNARRTKCANNLRQIGIAFASFAHDHNDRYPQQVPLAEGGSREQNLEAPVLNGQYILSPLAFIAASSAFQSAQIMVCPSTKMWVSSFADLRLTNLCYALNLQAEAGSSTSVLATDSHLLGDWQKLNQTTIDMGQSQVLFANSRHDNKGNVVFGDSHVELRKSVAVSPAQLAAAAQSVASVKNPPRTGNSAPPPPTEQQRQAAYQAANPAPAGADYGASTAASVDLGRSNPGTESTFVDAGARTRKPKAAPHTPAGTNAATALASVAPPISSTEVTLRRSLFWLWLLLMLLGAAMLWWHFHREKQRRQTRQLRWQAYAAEQEQARAERLKPLRARV